MKFIVPTTMAIFILSGCTFPVHNYGVDSKGMNVYTVNVDSRWREKAHNTALKIANEYCEKKGLKMNPVKEINSPEWSYFASGNHSTKLFFNCL